METSLVIVRGGGEIATIPTAPAAAGAYYALDHIFRTKFPMEETAYSRPKKVFGSGDDQWKNTGAKPEKKIPQRT